MHAASGHTTPSRHWLPIGLGQIVAFASGLAGIRLATQWVPPNDFGVYGLFLSLVPLGGMLTHAGLIKHFSRHWLSAPNRAIYLRDWSLAGLRPALWLLFLGMVVGGMQLLAPAVVIGALALIVAGHAGACAQAFHLGVQSAGRYWTDFGLTAINSTTRTFFPLLSIAVSGGSLVALIYGFVIHAVVIATLGLWIITRLGRNLPMAKDQSAVIPASLEIYTRYFLVNGIMAVLNQGVIRWCASVAYDATTLGYITMAGNLASVGPSMLAGALWQYHYSKLLASHHTGDRIAVRHRANRALVSMVVGCVIGGVTLAAVLPHLPNLLIAESYRDALSYVLPLFAFYTGLCGLTLLQGESLVLDRPGLVVCISLVGTLFLSGGTILTTLLAPNHLVLWLWICPLPTLGCAWLLVRHQLK
jgi:hypothetical protein